MALIYEPRGPAREYAPLAVNLYKGCAHGCRYCYAPRFAYRGLPAAQQLPAFSKPTIVGRAVLSEEDRAESAIARLRREAPRHTGQSILMSFTCDPYQPLEKKYRLTRQALEIFAEAGVLPTILTKAPSVAVAEDLKLLVAARATLAVTLCWVDDKKRLDWEPFTDSVAQRLEALAAARSAGLKTWVSIEPIMEPAQASGAVESLVGKVDLLKIGTCDPRWNPTEHAAVDWPKLLETILPPLVESQQPYYIKDGFWRYANADTKKRFKQVS